MADTAAFARNHAARQIRQTPRPARGTDAWNAYFLARETLRQNDVGQFVGERTVEPVAGRAPKIDPSANDLSGVDLEGSAAGRLLASRSERGHV